jgi:4,4'-diaponeurosporenoate glycosyltransferase
MPLLALYVVISLCAGVFLFYGFPLLTRKERGTGPVPKISIIIPARNEEKNLPVLLCSIKNQGVALHEVIVVNDSSTDETATIASGYGAYVIDSGPLPEGWLGKPWGCYQGAQQAKGDIFIFLDADTFFEPEGLERIIDNYNEGAGVISFFPYHRIKKSYETFSAFFNLMQLAGIYSLSLSGKRQSKGLFGPCLVISREDYYRTGGHAAVKDRVLEHYSMGAILIKHNIPSSLFRGKGVLNVRMYPEGLGSLINGWRKSFALGADETPRLNMTIAVSWISGLIAAMVYFTVALLNGDITHICYGVFIYLICGLQLFIHFRRIGNFPLWSALFYPAVLIFFLSLFAFAAAGPNRPVKWKGRKID